MEEKLGPFILKDVIGQGGMGKVYKAYDPINQRTVALKVIKDSLLKNHKAKKRFLQEAFIQSHLSHPAIIPMHTLEDHPQGLGYSMPFIQGSTLKTILLKLRQDPSIMPLNQRLNHFYRILEACEYTHEMGFIHRDIKADNIFIGSHNETYLFDWGLAFKHDDSSEEEDFFDIDTQELTKPGKIPGTLTHLAPERALGVKGSFQTDIFSLGVVLYQLLTLKMPFYRKDLAHFKQIAGSEIFIKPSELNVKDDIDEALDLIIARALDNDPKKRYTHVKDFKEDLQQVLRGLPIWKDPLLLTIKNSSQWLFQDLLPLGSYLALSQKSLSWGLLSVPNLELVDNYKLEIDTYPTSSFKLYLNLAQEKTGFSFDHSYIIHIDPQQGLSLNRAFALIKQLPLKFESHKSINISVCKIENRFYVYLNHQLIFDFISRVPSICPYIGLVIEDTTFDFSSIKLFKTSSSKQISCLKLGDTLALVENFSQARIEYEKILTSFQNHTEGGDALFRIGYSYILESRKNKKKKKHLLNQAIVSFERFKTHKASPWEYWGKALCYEALKEKAEMIKCFELGFRKYPHHVFTAELEQELVVLFSQKSTKAKKEALMLAFVALKYLEDADFLYKYRGLIDSLEEELKDIFILYDEHLSLKQKLLFALAFVLKQKTYLHETLEKSKDLAVRHSALLLMAHLNDKAFTKRFSLKYAKQLVCPDLLDTSQKDTLPLSWALAKEALSIYGQLPENNQAICHSKQAFLKGLFEVIYDGKNRTDPHLSDYDNKILKNLSESRHLSLDQRKNLFKESFFQESDRFIRSNFIISLIDKKPIDYFGYDKAALEFAIKALF